MVGIKVWKWLYGLGITFFSTYLFTNSTVAQIRSDATLLNNSNVTINGSTNVISGGTTVGANLFHSFSEFSVPAGVEAFFNNAQDIQNILTRVTGTKTSNINGLVRASGKANLFLINPNGITFGQNASLNIGGSFVATTANAIEFGNGKFFSASNLEAPSPLLTINPTAFLFNQISAPIQNNSVSPINLNSSRLGVRSGKSLLLVGGDVNMNGGQLNANSGRVELGGLASQGSIGITKNGDSFNLNFPGNIELASVSLENSARVHVESEGEGSIAINARNINILGNSWLSAGIGENLGNSETVAGDITLSATETIKVVGSYISNLVWEQAQGNGGNLIINTDSLLIRDGAQVSTSTFGEGKGGNLDVKAQTVELIGANSGLFAQTSANAKANAGNVNINTDNLLIQDGANVSAITGGGGNGGNLTVTANEVQLIGTSSNGSSRSGLLTFAAPGATGAAGNITINTGSLRVENGAEVSAKTFSPQKGGNLNVNATRRIQLVGVNSQNSKNTSGLFTQNGFGQTGNAGNISLNSPEIIVKDGAEINTDTSGGGNGGNLDINAQIIELIGLSKDSQSISKLSAQTMSGTGNAGNLTINTNLLSIRDGAQINTSTSGKGSGGRIDITASSSVNLDAVGNFSSVIVSDVQQKAEGNSGGINIKSGSLFLNNNVYLSARTFGKGNAGNVFVKANDSVSLFNGVILSTVESGAVGNGGNIIIDAASLSLQNGAQLLTLIRGNSETKPAGRGDAGNINIGVSGAIIIDGINNQFKYPSAIFSDVDTNAIGNGGNVNISAGSLSLTNNAYLSASIESGAKGNGGNIDITTNSVSLDNGGNLYARIRDNAIGNGGNIKINTSSFSAARSSELEVSTRGRGTSGNINIEAKDFLLSSNAALIGDVGAGGQGGGNINLIVDGSVLLIGDKTQTAFTGESTRITSGVQPFGQGTSGNVAINANSLVLKDGAFIKASTQGGGTAGNIDIKANIVDISGNSPSGLVSGLFTSTDTSFKAGNILVNTDTFKIADSAALSARSRGSGQGGNITVNTRYFEAMNGGQLLTTTASSGQAGNVLINAKDLVNISSIDQNYETRITQIQANEQRIREAFSNPDEATFQLSLIANAIKETGASGIFTSTESNSSGKGGDIAIRGGQLNIKDGAQVTAKSQGSGNAGNIQSNSNRIILDKGATINADTTGGGGNINLQSPLLILRRGSNITTNASGNNITGGNIDINSQNGFIVAVPKENSNIRADSANARGGNINIQDIAGIFGIQARLSPTGNTSEITAKGATPELSGNIQITPPDTDPSSGLIELSTNLVDASNQISNACTPGTRQFENTFTTTGRSGLPISPTEPLQDQSISSAWVRFNQTKPENSTTTRINQPSLVAAAPAIVEASGWIADKSGNIELVAPVSQTPQQLHSVSCHVSQ